MMRQTGFPVLFHARRFFFRAFILAAFLHAVALVFCLSYRSQAYNLPMTSLAVMDFSDYDPDGGQEQGEEVSEQDENPATDQLPEEPDEKQQEKTEEIYPASEPEQNENPEEVTEADESQEKTDELPEISDNQEITSLSEHTDAMTQKMAAPTPSPQPVASPDPLRKKTKTAQKIPSRTQKHSSTSFSEQKGTGRSGRGGSGGGAGKGNPDAYNAYTSYIALKLNRGKKYPPDAKKARLTGTVLINFTVNRQGQVAGFRLVRSSGHSSLDGEVMALIRRVSPFKPIPENVGRNSINLSVPIRFSL